MRSGSLLLVFLMTLQGCGSTDEPPSWGVGGKSEDGQLPHWAMQENVYPDVKFGDVLEVNVTVPKSPFVFWMTADLSTKDLELFDPAGVVYKKGEIAIPSRKTTKAWHEGTFNLACKECEGTETTLAKLLVLGKEKATGTVQVHWSAKHCPPDSVEDGGLCEAFAKVHDGARAKILDSAFCNNRPLPLKQCGQARESAEN